MEAFVLRLEVGCKEEIRSLKSDIHTVQTRTETLEASQVTLQENSLRHDQQFKTHEEQLHTLFLLYDDMENRNRHNNIHLRGIPEATGDEHLLPTVKGIFSRILRAPADLEIVFIRALGPCSTDFFPGRALPHSLLLHEVGHNG